MNNPFLTASYYNVTLTTSAPGLPAGLFLLTGAFYPTGQLGARQPVYSYRLPSRAAYDSVCRSVSRMHGNTVAGANALFAAFKPLSFPGETLRHDVTFTDGSHLPVFVAANETFGKALARLGFKGEEVSAVAVDGPKGYLPDYCVASY